MIIFKKDDIIPEEFNNAVIAIGNFDGVHTGHQEVIKTCKQLAVEYNTKAMVLTFDPHPATILSNRSDYSYIYSMHQKQESVAALGIDAMIIETFSREFAQLTAQEFILNYLVKKYKVRHVVTGYNFNFGRDKSGNPEVLSEFAKNYNFKYTMVEPVDLKNLEISSSRIKQLLSQGRVSSANKLLAANYSITGRVVEGNKIARKVLETPTANININQNLFLPLHGVYLVSSSIGGKSYYGIANLGVRPTLEDIKPTFEVHLLNFDGDIYNLELKVELLNFIRPERKFEDLNALKKQIKRDIVAVRYTLDNAPQYTGLQ